MRTVSKDVRNSGSTAPQPCDAVIFGGGVAGLWLLDALSRRGYAAVLLESRALGAGQTITSQGILHSGLKYTLDGLLNASAEGVRDWPAIWRECLRGEQCPDLRAARVLSDECHLWRTSNPRSMLGMVGARVGLKVRPEPVAKADRPTPLRECPGSVFRLAEQVIEPASLLSALRAPHASRVALIDGESVDIDGRSVCVHSPTGDEWRLAPNIVFLTAGAGNAALHAKFGLDFKAMQRRPLHMALAKGPLPPLFGHCVDGAHTRVTITTARLESGESVWQIGGQVAEDGVALTEDELAQRAKREVASVLPGVDLSGVLWSSYRVDRAEAENAGKRPSDATVLREGAVVTVWPTKLVLAPRAAELALREMPEPVGHADIAVPPSWPRPAVAAPPWESATWKRVD
ncbi:MAG: FAD-dependent oxidoreductase [Phycisphaerales bacterium]|nr:FAD-dependent oxidoreductase [Phycisphaerales bacterium]